MNVLGNFVAVKNPLYKESIIELDEATKQKMVAEQLDKLDKLEVVKVGQDTTKVQVGNFVYVDTSRIINAPRVVIEKEGFIFLRETDIIFIY